MLTKTTANSRREAQPLLGFVIRPSAAIVTSYTGAVAFWLIFVLVTGRFGPTGTELHLISLTEVSMASCVNAAVLAWLIVDGWTSLRRAILFRRSQLVGLLVCVANLALLQWALFLAHNPL